MMYNAASEIPAQYPDVACVFYDCCGELCAAGIEQNVKTI